MKSLFRCLPVFAALLVAACGTVATPEWAAEAQETRAALAVTSDYETSIAPTATPLPPTSTPTSIPPTATPTSEPPTPTTEPATFTPVPTVEATEEASVAAGAAEGDAANGQVLFTTFYEQTNFACATCHYVDQEGQLIGPGLLNISVHAETRVEGESAYEYIHNSIVHPSAYVVEGYPDGLMPQVYGEIFTEEEINDIIAYLYTLK